MYAWIRNKFQAYLLLMANLINLNYSPSLTLTAGVDEVGRGALFGLVVAAAVALQNQVLDELADSGVTDSKKLTEKHSI